MLLSICFISIFTLNLVLAATEEVHSEKIFIPKEVTVISQNELLTDDITELIEDLDSLGVEPNQELSEEMKASIEETVQKTIIKIEEENKDLISAIKKEQIIENNNSGNINIASSAANTSTAVRRYFKNNLNTANNIRTNYNQLKASKGTTVAEAYRGSLFAALVKSGGAWDLKRPLGTKNTYSFNGSTRTGEYIGNAHYGYMGKAILYGNTTLKTAADLYQVVFSGTSSWSYYTSYFDDPANTAAITYGINLYLNGVRF